MPNLGFELQIFLKRFQMQYIMQGNTELLRCPNLTKTAESCRPVSLVLIQ